MKREYTATNANNDDLMNQKITDTDIVDDIVIEQNATVNATNITILMI